MTIKGGIPEQLRFMGIFRPNKLMQKSSILWEDVSVGNAQGNTHKPQVKSIKSVGIKEVITLGTEHKTFIAEGLISHNSDQRRWQIKCGSCGKCTCLADTFPHCIIQKGGRWYRSCIHCQAEIFVQDGNWFAEFPDRREAGFFLTRV